MSKEGTESQSEVEELVQYNASTDNIRMKICIMRIATVAFSILALIMIACLLFVGVMLIIASNIGLESLTSIPLPLSQVVGVTVCLIITVGVCIYTSMRHKELLAELHVALSR